MPSKRTDIDMEMLRTLYINERKSLIDCSGILKCSVYVVRDRLKKIGCEIRKSGEWAKGITLGEDQKKKLSLSHLGKIHNIETKRKISEGLKGRECSKETRLKLSKYRLKNELDINKLIELYCDKKATARYCAEYFNVGLSTITKRLRRNNIEIRPNKYIDIELLKKLYIEEKKSLLECSEILKIDKATIAKNVGTQIRNPGLKKGSIFSEQAKRNMSIAQIEIHRDKSVPADMKRCANCKKVLLLSEYHRSKRRSGSYGYQSNCKKCSSEINKKYRANNIDEVREKGRKYARQHKEEISIKAKEKTIELKKEVFEAYGGIKCSCCGVTDLVFLTIDHINGGGGKHRKRIKNSMYQWLKNNNYPPGYRVLCWNCNWAEAHGGCPHVQ